MGREEAESSSGAGGGHRGDQAGGGTEGPDRVKIVHSIVTLAGVIHRTPKAPECPKSYTLEGG